VNDNPSVPATSQRPDAGRATASNAALLIDFDNVTLGIRSDLQHQLRRLLNSEMIRGKVAVQRAYADWRRYPQYIVPLSEASIDLIFAPAFGSNKKNATDIRLAIDALELVFTRPEIGTFILLSGDSDFSSLVLKLKEYGKWVIGVGIRESASDLLVQNCDEYFSYSELTGLTKTSEAEDVRRDPWELVVEAVLRMKDSNDTMRSDRLKQVMQQIDPHFDEKDAGFNRFSKFVLDAGHRGLLALHKMENGQYEIDIGPDANTPPEAAVAKVPEARVPDADAAPVEQLEKRPRRRPAAASRRGMTLSSAFATLKAVLVELGAVDEEVADVERVRTAMMESAKDADDPLFEPDRFMKMLRQADDAELVELAKNRHGDVVSLLPGSVAETAAEPEAKPAKRKSTKGTKRARAAKSETAAPDAEEQHAEPKRATKKAKKTTKAKKATKAKSTRTAKKDAPQADAAEPVAAEPTKAPSRPAGSRSLRGRGSSRTRKPAAKLPAREPQPEPAAEPRPPASPGTPASPRTSSDGPRSLRGRGGSRGRRAPAQSPAKESSSKTGDRLPARERAAKPAEGPAVRDRGDKPADRLAARGDRPPGAPRRNRNAPTQKRTTTSRSDAMIQRAAEAESPPEPEKESGGLFKRMTAALQKALGEETDD
jgi:uncharacterized protein (TIGR00288 family)